MTLAIERVSEECWGFALAKDVKRWKKYGPDSDDLPPERDESSMELPEKRKADAKSSKDEVGTLRARDVSLQKRSHLPRRLKLELLLLHLLGSSTSSKIGGMPNVWDILVNSSGPHQSRDNDRTGRNAPSPNHRDPVIEPRAIKHRVDLALLTPLEVRMKVAKKSKKSSTRVKGSSETRTAGPKVDMSNFARDACVSDLLKMNFLSSQSTCVKLSEQINVVDIKDAEEHVADETTSIEDDVKEGVTHEVATDVAEQAVGAAE
ncbi:hypothetical protein ACE6H2_020370 [Prunus campanulata]